MNKITTGIAVILLSLPVSAFAYQLPAPMKVTSSFVSGQGEVDFSKPSVVEGTFKMDTLYGKSAWITAGDVAHNDGGYGFAVHDGMLFAITDTGYVQMSIPMGYLTPDIDVNVRAEFTPGVGVKFDTSTYQSYGLGIEQQFLPQPSYHKKDGLNSLTDAVLTIGSWSYQQ